ncbi:putative necrosis-inducing factor-domain-containing protein [Hypoxylon crocopeplum]|nr:putative necrosis-inducing factor-domain-containing protein [Hypoxylon crocopeplum]
MHWAKLTTLISLGMTRLGTSTRLPCVNGTFVEHQIQHSNGSTVKMYLRDSYQPSQKGAGDPSKRFYETYHNDTQKYEICAETNFIETTTADSALCDDCSAIMTQLRASPGFFETGDYTDSDYNYLAVCGTCAFGVYRTDGLSARVDIGSKDVVDNINVALIRFQRDGHVGATGTFACNSAPINWAILRTT